MRCFQWPKHEVRYEGIMLGYNTRYSALLTFHKTSITGPISCFGGALMKRCAENTKSSKMFTMPLSYYTLLVRDFISLQCPLDAV